MTLLEHLRPTSLETFIGNRDAVIVAEAYMDGRSKTPAAIFMGQPGTGKTTLAHILAEKNGLEPVEINASAERNKKQKERILSQIRSNTVYGKQKLLIVDEAEAPGVYIFPILPGGTYTVSINKTGYLPAPFVIELADGELGLPAPVKLTLVGGGLDDVWVQFADGPPLGDGSSGNPFTSLPQAVAAVTSGGNVHILPGTSADPITISKPMILIAQSGPVLIGVAGGKSVSK